MGGDSGRCQYRATLLETEAAARCIIPNWELTLLFLNILQLVGLVFGMNTLGIKKF